MTFVLAERDLTEGSVSIFSLWILRQTTRGLRGFGGEIGGKWGEEEEERKVRKSTTMFNNSESYPNNQREFLPRGRQTLRSTNFPEMETVKPDLPEGHKRIKTLRVE